MERAGKEWRVGRQKRNGGGGGGRKGMGGGGGGRKKVSLVYSGATLLIFDTFWAQRENTIVRLF